MTERKWTKGPWVWDKRHPFNVYSDDATGSIVSTTDGFKYAPRHDAEKQANANLIAAAPDLYEALEKCLGSLMSNYHNEYDGVYSDSDFDNIERPYLAALAKARGENQ